MIKSKWHNISIKTESFEELKELQNLIPIRVSIPQTIEWLIKVGQQDLKYKNINPNQSEKTNHEDTSRISK
jgi:hypothetical protein